MVCIYKCQGRKCFVQELKLDPICIYGFYVVAYATIVIYTENPPFLAEYSLSLQVLFRFQECSQLSCSYPFYPPSL